MLLLFLVAVIGFNPDVNDPVLESAGLVNFNFEVLEGNIAFDVSVLFFTTGETATSKSILQLIVKPYQHCNLFLGCAWS